MGASNLIQSAMARLGLGETTVPTQVSHDAKADPSPSTSTDDLTQFENRLGQILARRHQNIDDRVFVISIDKWAAKLGDKWGDVRAKADATARAIFKQRLSEHSLYVQRDEYSYLIVMSGATIREAQLRSRIIGDELQERLAGRSNETELVDVKAVEVDAEGHLFLHDLSPMQDLLEEVPDELSKNAPTAKVMAPGFFEEGNGAGLQEVKFIYRPMLAVRTKVLSTFMSVPICQVHGKFFQSGYDVLGQRANSRQYLDLDLLTVRRVGEDLRNLMAKGAKSLLALPVHYETLAGNRRRHDYVSLCASEFHGMTDRIVFELVGLPEGIPQVRLTELVSLLRPVGRAIIARFPVERRNFDAFRIGGLHAVGIDLYNNHKREENLMQNIDEFAQVANKNRLKTFASGVRSISLYTAVVAAGYDYAAGHALTSIAETPENASVFRMDSPYLAILDAAREGNNGRPTFEDDDVLGMEVSQA